jgi:hypothetical protein
MELFVFLVIVFLGLGYLARRQVLPRTQRQRDQVEANRPIGYGEFVAPAGTAPGASVQAPFFGSDRTGETPRSHGADE